MELREQFWFLSGLYLWIAAILLRLLHANELGNVWAAFIPDTFIGYPWFHILGVIGLGCLLIASYYYDKK